MDRLTVADNGQYIPKCTLRTIDGVTRPEGCANHCGGRGGECNGCGIQQAFNRLAAYEDTGLTPDEVAALKAFKAYFKEMYGKGLEVVGFHLNGTTEPFDNFYESACENTEGKE